MIYMLVNYGKLRKDHKYYVGKVGRDWAYICGIYVPLSFVTFHRSVRLTMK